MAMKHIPIASSNISTVGYDRPTNTLEIKFKSGKTYSYEGIPRHVYNGLLESDSAGKYFNSHIVGKFHHSEV